ncbi:8018_t:CDS:10 [Paraglomus occultum]|uniref:Ubiquitin thioesterase OTU n=1 Tax=Paraglomus occultum TaxID=144539 RepID=A0A9N8W6Y8_9GLOM|nr:8018_t:CDS:10 [Paraglomus occultum]
MRLRVRYRDQNQVINNLDETSTVGELKKVIHNEFGISQREQELKCGYPPRISTASDESSLESAGIRNGETIIVDKLELPPEPVLTPVVEATVIEPLPDISAQTTSRVFQATSVPEAKVKGDLITVQTRNGYAMLREMEDDNSCLFRAIVIVKKVQSDPVTYNDAFLGMSNDEYCTRISGPNTWGGAIELSIFSEHFNVEILSIDVGTGRVDRYGQNNVASKDCVYIIYSGIHYDAIVLTPLEDGSVQDFDQTVFDVNDMTMWKAAENIAKAMNMLHKYTYTATFTIKCRDCGVGLKGEKEAAEHAKGTVREYLEELWGARINKESRPQNLGNALNMHQAGYQFPARVGKYQTWDAPEAIICPSANIDRAISHYLVAIWTDFIKDFQNDGNVVVVYQKIENPTLMNSGVKKGIPGCTRCSVGFICVNGSA